MKSPHNSDLKPNSVKVVKKVKKKKKEKTKTAHNSELTWDYSSPLLDQKVISICSRLFGLYTLSDWSVFYTTRRVQIDTWEINL